MLSAATFTALIIADVMLLLPVESSPVTSNPISTSASKKAISMTVTSVMPGSEGSAAVYSVSTESQALPLAGIKCVGASGRASMKPLISTKFKFSVSE